MTGLPDNTRACLFDLDGVLTCTATVQAAAWKALFDGCPRYDEVRSFLAARGIELPDAGAVRGLGNRKNELVLRIIRDEGVEADKSLVCYREAARDAGLRRDVLVAAETEGFFEARIDGVMAGREGLEGKPAPGTFRAARQAGAPRERGASLVVSDLSELLEDG